ncbi:sulfurtransferase TusA family protein [Sporanaerobacter acetigenes]|jgi:tRNA 2-thiouridine synthesizing protein A|uniref:TusA-related sulfurtransferase n=1 Tax=Sporanaerobacter acetigenes DSM 13106 TaxID=1123281 RepID=A0A1M5X8N1_9FIRM|nr:sulfurtransferase TusA family protein [Sporanaerobacter acetigenes]SHH96197.1 TusA-related sulfurtransferase [Sporanaerobacter acetigenes DSM 13106]
MEKIDVRGMSCPQPVLMTKNAIEKHPEGIDILVDNNTAKNNITRFLKNSGYKLEFKNEEEDTLIVVRK